MWRWMKNYIIIWRVLFHMCMFYLLLCLSLLIFTCFSFLSLKIFMWESTSIQLHFCSPLFYVASAWFVAQWHINIYLIWYIYHTLFDRDLPHIYIVTKMDSLLTNKRELASQVTEALNTEIYERNIWGGVQYNRAYDFSKYRTDIFFQQIDRLENRGGGI